jgi:MinD-like ATPase involved in chromosome partitioning or flagellar assembly
VRDRNYWGREKVGKTIAVLSVKGGVGKSVSTIGLGIWTTKLTNEWVLIVDGDAHVRTAELKLCPTGRTTLADVLRGDVDLQEAVRPCDLANEQKKYLYPRLLVLPAGDRFLPPVEGTLLTWLELIGERFNEIMTNLRERWVTPDGSKGIPHIFIDTPASFGFEHLILCAAADGVVYVLETCDDSINSAKQADRDLKELFGKHFRSIGVILNNVPKSLPAESWVKKACEIAPVLGIVPQDAAVGEAFRINYPFDATNPECPANLAFREIATKLLKIDVKPVKLLTKMNHALVSLGEEIVETIKG